MNPIKVYYYACDIKGAIIVTLTEATEFDTHGCIDGYGLSEHYEKINDAMHNCGATDFGGNFDCNHSVYQLPFGSTMESIVVAMSKKGFNLVNDPDFVKFCTETDVIYYCSKLDEGELRIVITSKAYWNRNQCVDDGSSLLDMLDYAMRKCGASEVCEAEYVLESGVTLKQLIDNMSKIGYTMITNPDFTASLQDWLTEEY